MIPRMVSLTRVEEWCDGEVCTIQDYLVGEEPLEIRVGDTALSVTMRTPVTTSSWQRDSSSPKA